MKQPHKNKQTRQMATVARINSATQTYLETTYKDVYVFDFVVDANSAIVMDLSDAEELLDPADYVEIDWEPINIGAPFPKKKKRFTT